MTSAARTLPAKEPVFCVMVGLWFGLTCALAVSAPVAAADEPARVIAAYAVGQTQAPDGVLTDFSTFGNDAQLCEGATFSGGLIDTSRGYVALPAGEDLWGPVAPRGTVALWVRPLFDPADPGYAMFFYCMQTDGNALPDGFDEIGIYLDHGTLVAKVNGPAAVSVVAALPAGQFLARGRWTHLALSWRPGLQCFWVGGKLVGQAGAAHGPPRLDAFRAELSRHPSSRQHRAPAQYAAVTIFDDFALPKQIAALAAAAPDRAPLVLKPPQPIIAALDWGRPWLGRKTLKATLQNPAPRAETMRVSIELTEATTASEARRREVAAKQIKLAPGRQAEISLDYQLSGCGTARLEFLVRRAGSDEVVAGRVRYVHIPPIFATIEAQEKRLSEVDGLALPPAARDEVQAARAHLSRLRARFLSGPSAEGSQANREIAELEKELAVLSQHVEETVSRARIAAALQGKPFALGWTHGTIKVLKTDPFPGRVEEPIVLEAARGEYEPAQMFVFAPGEPLEHLRVRVSDLKGPGGAVIPASEVSWRVVEYAVTSKPYYEVRHIGEWPDPLREREEFAVSANGHTIIWLTVRVPRDATPGDYEGEVAVSGPAGQRSLPMRLHVWGFALPDRSSLKTAFGLNSCGNWQSKMNVDEYIRNCAEHRVSVGFPGLPWVGPVIQKPAFDWTGQTQLRFSASGSGEGLSSGRLFLVCDAGEHVRATYGPFEVTPAPHDFSVQLREPLVFTSLRFEWRGAGPVEIAISPMLLSDGTGRERVFDQFTQTGWWTPVGRDVAVSVGNGKLHLTVAAPSDPAALYKEWPAAERSASDTPAERDWKIDWAAFDAVVEKYYPWAINVIWLPLPGVPREASMEEARRILSESGLARIAAEAERHLAERGWLDDAYTYLWDEPEAQDYPVVDLATGVIKQSAPRLRNMMTARGFPSALRHVDIWCPEIYSFDPIAAEQERAKGKHIWWYVAFSCRHPYPNFWIDYPALDCRAVFWLTWKHRIECFLYWSISNWWMVKDPLREQTFPNANGDGTLIYPGEDGRPIDTIRWENIREGLEDYEYFVLLRDAVEKARKSGRASPELMARAERLLAIDDAVVKDYASWSQDPEAYLQARREMARTIEALM